MAYSLYVDIQTYLKSSLLKEMILVEDCSDLYLSLASLYSPLLPCARIVPDKTRSIKVSLNKTRFIFILM
jgi:hypothetical protein